MKKEYWRRINRNKAKREYKRQFGHCNWCAGFIRLCNYWDGFIKEF